MWTLFTDRLPGRHHRSGVAALALAAALSGCAVIGGSGLEESAEGHNSKYTSQKAGGAAADSDAQHIPSVPHDPAVESIAKQAMSDYQHALQTRMAGDNQQALGLFQALAERYPQLSGPQLNAGLIYMEMEKYSQADAAFRQSLAINSANPYAHNGLGLALREQGKFAQSRRHYERALELDPKYARAHFNLAVLGELYLQDLGLALTHFRAYQNLQTQPDSNVANWIVDLERRVPDAADQPVADSNTGNDNGEVN